MATTILKKSGVLAFFLFINFLSFSQELPYAWLKSIQPVTVQEAPNVFPVYNINDIEVDAAGNVYATGFYKGLCDFDPGPGQVTQTAIAERDVFIAKYSANGDLLWVTNAVGYDNAQGLKIDITSTSKVIVVGRFANTIVFDPAVTNTSLYADGTDMFVAQYDGNTGAFENVFSISGFGDQIPNALEVVGTDIYIAGTFQGTVEFLPNGSGGNSLIMMTSGNTTDNFLIKYSSFNLPVWGKQLTGYNVNSMTSSSSDLVLTGTYFGSIDFDPSAGNSVLTSTGSNLDMWISKFNLNGDFQWAKSLGGSDVERSYDVVIDNASNIYATGTYKGTIDLDPNAGVANHTCADNFGDAFIVKLDATGNYLWSKNFGGTDYDDGTSIAIFNTNKIVVTGNFQSPTIDLDPGTGTVSVTNNGNYDVYISYYDEFGNLLHGFGYGNPSQDFDGALLESNGTDKFVAFGDYAGTVDFDPSNDVSTLTNNLQQGYITYYGLLAPVPASQPTLLNLTPTDNSVSLSFTAASDAEGYVVIRKLSTATTQIPKDGRTYQTGESIGDSFIAYAGTATNFTNLFLPSSKTYSYSVFSYKNTGGYINYLTATPLSGSTTTLPITYSLQSDSLALVALYNNTNGASWTNNSGWLSGPVSTWYGVTVSGAAPRVTSIYLNFNNLSGTLPPLIGNLNALTSLNLSNNALSGNLIDEFYGLLSLNSVNFSNNYLTGTLSDSLGNLTNLLDFNATNNLISGSIPSTIGNLTGLTALYLNQNQLSGSIPIQIGSMTSLQNLNLSSNKLTGAIPTEIGNLSAAFSIVLYGNQLSGTIPSIIGNLTSLNELNLSNNQLTGSIPVSVGSLSNATFIDLSGNQLSGSIPVELGNLTAINTLILSYNTLSGAVPIQLGSLLNLFNLSLDGNLLTDLPNFSTSNISQLNVTNNQFTFEDLEPNIAKLVNGYSPQANVGVSDTLSFDAGQTMNLAFTVGGSANSYQWLLNGQPVSGATSTSLSRVLSASDVGTWQLSVTNSIAPDLTIFSAPITVKVKAEGMFLWADAGDLTLDGLNSSLYGGVWGDYDNDGDDDVLTLGVSLSQRGYLYTNNGNGSFTRIPKAVGFHTGRSGNWADYNNDGFVDLFMPGGSFVTDSSEQVAAIYKNNQNGTFTKISLNQPAISGTWSDFDYDGDLDLAIEGTQNSQTIGFRNDGNDVFSPTNLLSYGTGWSAIAVDVNNDSRLDYYMPSTNQNPSEVKLFLKEETTQLYDGYLNFSPMTSQPRGGSWGDIDNDGDMDLFMMIQSIDEHRFYINDGFGQFTEYPASNFLGDPIKAGRASSLADFNNDGYLDVIVFQNAVSPFGLTIYINNGNLTFSKLTNQTFKDSDVFSGVSLSDYDNDGDIDIFSSAFNGTTTNGLYTNLTTGNHFLKIKLLGTQSNRQAIGSQISVYAGGIQRYTQVITSNGFANQNSIISHFGLGSSASADSIKIIWPTGRIQWFMNQAGDQLVTYEEPLEAAYTGDAELIITKQVRGLNPLDKSDLSTFTTLDDQGNSYITGTFYGSIDLDPGTSDFILTGPSANTASNDGDTYIAKYDMDGNFIWGKQISIPANNSLRIRSITLDKDNNILIAGQFRGTITLDASSAEPPLTSTSVDFSQAFLAKFDNNGNLLWSNQFTQSSGTNPQSEISEIKSDSQGNIYVTAMLDGYYPDNTVNIATSATPIIISITSGDELFIVKYSSAGDYISHTLMPGSNERDGSFVFDSNDNMYICYAEVTNTLTSESKVVIKKFDSAMSQLWSIESTPSVYEKDDNRILIFNNTLYITGGYSQNFTLTGTSGSQTLTGNAQSNIPYVIKMDLNGAIVWMKDFPTNQYAGIYGIGTTPNDDVILSGYFVGSLDMNPGPEDASIFHPAESSFGIKLTSNGDYVWGFKITNSFMIHNISSKGEMIVNLVANGSTDLDPTVGKVIGNPVGTENLFWLKFDLNLGISAIDSLVLKAFYDATGGPNWTNNTNWLSGDLSTWHGVTVTNNKIVSIALPNNNLTGDVPNDFSNLNELSTIDLSQNKITSIPDLSAVPALTTLNVADNSLQFGSLEPNIGIQNFSYSNQAAFGQADSVLIPVGDPYSITHIVSGTQNQYVWKKNNVIVDGAVSSSYDIATLDKTSMGKFTLEVTNNIVPGLTLVSNPISVMAVSTLSGKLYVSATEPATSGEMTLLRVTQQNGYDTTRVVNINGDGTYLLENIVLDTYQLLGFPDTLVYSKALPTYYNNKLYWEEADTLVVEGNLSNLDIIAYEEPTAVPTGQGLIDGYVVEEVPDGGRTNKQTRVKGAGASVRRVEEGGRDKEEILTLYSYVFTNDNGEFSFPNLPEGNYRLNIQYPGYPMDTTSFVTITVGSLFESIQKVEAAVEQGKIVVRKLIVTGLPEQERYELDVYPNPASEEVHFKFNGNKERSIRLIDMKGLQLMEQPVSSDKASIDVHLLPKGVYIISVHEDGKVRSVRLEIK